MARTSGKLVALTILLSWYGHAAACGPLLAGTTPQIGVTKRAITARDLIELRDIGDAESGNYGAPSRLAIAPDGRHVAFSLIRADLAANQYCIGVFVSAIAPSATPRAVNTGGELIPEQDNLRGYMMPSGAHAAVVPVWSPDGRFLAFLRRDRGMTRLWVADASGAGSRAVTHTASDMDAFAWSADGKRLVFATHPGVAQARADTLSEGVSGWLYDARIAPSSGAAPLVAADMPRVIESVGIEGGEAAKASDRDAARLPPEGMPGVPVEPLAMTADGRRATSERAGSSLLAPVSLLITDAKGRTLRCAADWCRGGITNLWWQSDGRALYVLRREGWNKGEIALYRWTRGKAARAIFRTRDDLQDCGWARSGLVCTRENATMPRRIVLIARGTSRVVFDPNPDFAAIALGRVRRLNARNALGLESWGDLVLPPDYKTGTKLPLVIVQYHSDGFLRGGTGDECPIFLLAARGFAVLSFERPPFFAAAYPNARSAFELNALNLKDWAERRSILSSLLAEVDRAVATGSVDAGRIGITGLSDGASTVQFALINSDRFAAASISSCCFDPRSVTTYAGVAFSDYVQKMGFPGATRNDPAFWQANSLAVSGRKINSPLLMQLADREYLGALETFEALREYGKAVELYVFPDEYHVKRQPVHRLAIYQRNLDWFGFWLQDRIDPDPAKRAQFVRWKAMRDARRAPQR